MIVILKLRLFSTGFPVVSFKKCHFRNAADTALHQWFPNRRFCSKIKFHRLPQPIKFEFGTKPPVVVSWRLEDSHFSSSAFRCDYFFRQVELRHNLSEKIRHIKNLIKNHFFKIYIYLPNEPYFDMLLKTDLS